MPLVYDDPPSSGALGQGEILADIWEHRALPPPIEIPQDSAVDVRSVFHPLVIVMTAVCDLEWDHQARFAQKASEDEGAAAIVEYDQQLVDDSDPGIVPHVLLCEGYQRDQIRPRFTGMTDIWKRIRQNQDERYHRFEQASIGHSSGPPLPELFLDFKKTLSLPTQALYEGLDKGSVRRVAVVPPVYLHDLMHRFYGFLSRVGVPD